MISFRVPDELADAVDELAASMGLSRSSAMRHVLARATGSTAVEAAIVEEALSVQAEIAKLSPLVWEAVLDVLRRELGGDAEPREVTALPAGSP